MGTTALRQSQFVKETSGFSSNKIFVSFKNFFLQEWRALDQRSHPLLIGICHRTSKGRSCAAPPAPPPSPRRPPAPPSVLGISYISFYRYRGKITNFLCSFMFWKTSAKRCENRRKPKARAKLEENQRRFYTVIILEFRCMAVHATLSFLASFSLVFVHYLFLGLSSCLGDANKQ